MDNEAKWKRRFHLFMAARLFGLAVFLFGMGIMFTNILRPGGWPLVGAILIILGLLDAVLAPNLLKKQWKKEDEQQ